MSLSAIPVAVYQSGKHHAAEARATQAQEPTETPGSPSHKTGAALAGELLMIGLASPFLDLSNPAQGLIGLIILFVGLRIAWRLTAGRAVQITGPLSEATPVAPG